MTFDETYTDKDFEHRFKQANTDWMAEVARREPDLRVDGMRGSLMSRLLGLFGIGEP